MRVKKVFIETGENVSNVSHSHNISKVLFLTSNTCMCFQFGHVYHLVLRAKQSQRTLTLRKELFCKLLKHEEQRVLNGFKAIICFFLFYSGRHEKPTDPDDPLSDQNIKDRFYGVNDPVAEKLLKRYDSMPKLEPPEDKNITTLYVGNLGEKIGEKELR